MNKDKRDEAREATVQNWITNRVETTGGVPSDYSSAEVEAVRFGFDAGATSVDRVAVDRWRPMEFAPKTGEHIQVINVDSHGFGLCGGKRQHASDVVHWFVDGFYSSVFGADQESPMIFTHWRPLPDKDAVLAQMEAEIEEVK